MSVPQNFRSAFNGFNREDVVKYIEYINAKHTAQVNQLTSETEFLQSKLNAMTEAPGMSDAVKQAEEERDLLPVWVPVSHQAVSSLFGVSSFSFPFWDEGKP